MTEGYLLWAAGASLLGGLGTWACIAAWDGWVRREGEAAQRLVESVEAEAARREQAERRAMEALAISERRHRALAEAGAIAVWRASAEGLLVAAEGWTALTGQAEAEVLGRAGAWLEAVDPEDRSEAAAAWDAAMAAGAPLDLECRLRTPVGEPRWCRLRGVPLRAAPGGPVAEWVGVVEDVHDRRRAEELRLLLMREVDHRAKNLLAVVQAIVRMSPAEEPARFVASVTARIAALGRAHDLLSRQAGRGASLRDVVERELGAHLDPLASGGRVLLDGPALQLAPAAVQPLAMVLHELATNAAKYGALSVPQGRVAVAWTVQGEELALRWEETGGPAPQRPARRGFGSRLLETSIRHQLRGLIAQHWLPQGLVCDIAIPLRSVVEGAPAG